MSAGKSILQQNNIAVQQPSEMLVDADTMLLEEGRTPSPEHSQNDGESN